MSKIKEITSIKLFLVFFAVMAILIIDYFISQDALKTVIHTRQLYVAPINPAHDTAYLFTIKTYKDNIKTFLPVLLFIFPLICIAKSTFFDGGKYFFQVTGVIMATCFLLFVCAYFGGEIVYIVKRYYAYLGTIIIMFWLYKLMFTMVFNLLDKSYFFIKEVFKSNTKSTPIEDK